MKTNIKVLGWLYILFGAIGLLITCVIAAAVYGTGAALGVADIWTEAPVVLGIVATVIMVAMLVLCIPNIIVGIGLLRFRAWARVMGIVLAVLSLPSVPIGTVFGIYALISLLMEDVALEFD